MASASSSSSRVIRKAVIPIAGYGSRMFPASSVCAKPLMPMLSLDGFCKPILQIIIEEALTAMTDDAKIGIIVQDGQQELVEGYFHCKNIPESIRKKQIYAEQIDKIIAISKRLVFIRQPHQRGFGDAILCAKDFVGQDAFLILLGDHVYLSNRIETCTKQLSTIYSLLGVPCTAVGLCGEDDVTANGIMKANIITKYVYNDNNDNNNKPSVLHIAEAYEKPSKEFSREHLSTPYRLSDGSPAYLCNFGIDLLTPAIFDHLIDLQNKGAFVNGELQLRDAMAIIVNQANDAPSGELIKEAVEGKDGLLKGLYGVLIDGQRLDTGQPTLYAIAMKEYLAEYEKKNHTNP